MPANHEPRIPYEQVARCLKYIQSWREHLAHAWVGRVRGIPDTRTIGDAVDALISLALLVEKARRTLPGSVPPLRDVIACSGVGNVQDLWTAVGQSTSSPILAAGALSGWVDECSANQHRPSRPRVLLVLLLLTRREFEMAVGSETDGSVNWAGAVYERVREFRPLLSACGKERVGSLFD